MYKLLLIPHKKISQKKLNEIIEIKTISWPYSPSEQLAWINSNIKENDIHVLLEQNDILVGYLNLIEINLIINGILEFGCGIGNVCSKEKGKGWGKELMERTNNFLSKNRKTGLLFCKKNLVRFYSQYNWRTLDKSILRVCFETEAIEVMIYSFYNDINNIEYQGYIF